MQQQHHAQQKQRSVVSSRLDREPTRNDRPIRLRAVALPQSDGIYIQLDLPDRVIEDAAVAVLDGVAAALRFLALVLFCIWMANMLGYLQARLEQRWK